MDSPNYDEDLEMDLPNYDQEIAVFLAMLAVLFNVHATSQKETRRIWSAREEQLLMDCFLDINNPTWKSNGTFKNGYLKQLEADIKKKILGVDIKAYPHIESKLQDWKKIHGLISSLVGLSGFGWSSSNNMVTNDDEDVWKNYMKKDVAIRQLRTKSFPFYPDWCKIWGNDRATGEFAETPTNVAEDLQQTRVGTNTQVHDLDSHGVGLEDIDASISANQNKLPKNFGPNPRKRRRMNEEIGKGLNKNLENGSKAMKRVADSLEAMVGRLGHENDQSNKREQLDELLEPLGLSLTERVSVAMQLALKPHLLDVFHGFKSNEARMEMVKLILKNNDN